MTGWLKDNSFGGGPAAALTSAGSSSPILGDGSANSAENVAIYASFPHVALSNGERITLSGSAEMIGTSSSGDFRWGLFKDDGFGSATGGWLGYMASAGSTVWSKDPAGTNFANATFASIANDRGVAIGNAAEPNGVPFGSGTYQFSMAVERFGNEIDVQISIVNNTSGFSIVSESFTEATAARLTYGFDRVGILAGSVLDADQIRFSHIDVATSSVEAPTLQVHSSGLVVLTNPMSQSFDLSHYEIRSNTGALNPAGWTSLASRENDDEIGVGWDEAGGSSTEVLAEVNLLSMATLENTQALSLGHAFLPEAAHDLAFRFTTPEGEWRRGIVEYVQSGDYNGDGQVNAADYVVWRRSLGNSVAPGAAGDGDGNGHVEQADYQIWTQNVGANTGYEAAAPSVVPEPTVAALGVVGMAAGLLTPALRKRKRYP